jgi:hypothetical protein
LRLVANSLKPPARTFLGVFSAVPMISTDHICWCCGTVLVLGDSDTVECAACQRPHVSRCIGAAVSWIPREVGGHLLDNISCVVDHGWQCTARDCKSNDQMTVTVLAVPAGPVRSELLGHVRCLIGRKHVNVVRVREVGEDGPLLWVAYDRFESQNLSEWQANSKAFMETGLSAKLDILAQVAKGLAFVHSCGSMHWRLQPSNVLIAEDGGVRIIPAWQTESTEREADNLPPLPTQRQSFLASPYAAPEMVAGNGASPAADSYSYGVIAYQLLTGLIPRGRFKSLNVQTPDCPAGVARCVDRCLEVTPTDRPKSDEIVRAHGDVNWGAENKSVTTIVRIAQWLRGCASAFREPSPEQTSEAAARSGRLGLATSIAWEACSFGLTGLLLGHVIGVALGTVAMYCGVSAGITVGLHHCLFTACGLIAATAGLWREQVLAFFKLTAPGRALLNVFTLADDYIDPKQKAAEALRLADAAAAATQLTVEELRRLLTSIDDAVTNLERNSFGGQSLPPIHRQLVEVTHRLAEKAAASRQYGIAREYYKRLAEAMPGDSSIAARTAQLTDLVASNAARIEQLFREGRLEDAGNRLESLAAHFPEDETIEKLRASYEERQRIFNDAKLVPLVALVRDNHWHRIGQVIEQLSSNGLPLGGFAKVVDECALKRVVFEREKAAALAALERLGPRRATPWLARLRAVIADHPFVQEFSGKLSAVGDARLRLKREYDTRLRQQRAIAAENTLRSFLLRYRLGSVSLLDDVESIAVKVRAEWCRWRLLLWFALAGLLFLAVASLFMRASGNEGVSEWQQRLPIPQQWQPLLGPAAMEGIRFLAAGVFLSVIMTIVGGRSIVLGPIVMGLAIIVTVATCMPKLWPFLVARASLPMPPFVTGVIANVPTTVNTMAWLMLFTATAACMANVPTWTPTLLASAFAIVSVFGITNGQAWAERLPEGVAAASLLAVVGVIRSAPAWGMISLSAAVASIIASASPFASREEGFYRIGATAIALLVTGVFVLKTRRVLNYVWLTVAVAAACLACWFVRGIDKSDSLMRGVVLWMIACAGVAISNKKWLGDLVRIGDMCRAYVLRVRCTATNLRGRLLQESEWYRDNRKWHAGQVSRDKSSSVEAANTGRRRPAASPSRE